MWLLILSVSSPLISQSNDTVYVKSSYNVDLCDVKDGSNPYEGAIQLMIDLGKVDKADSLFGYDFELKYNPDLIKLTAPLYFNTLTEYMDEKNISFIQDSGSALGYGLSMSIYNPVFGNRKLVAMRGDYLGNCPDTTFVDLNYIEFTEEFSRNIKGYKSAKIISYIDYSDERYFNTISSKNVEIDSIGYEDFELDISTIAEHDVSEFIVIIDKPQGNFRIDSIQILSDKVVLNNKKVKESTIELNFTAFDNLDDETLLRAFVYSNENKDDNEKIDIKIELLDNCSCITNINGNEISLKSNFKDVNSSVNDEFSELKWYYDSINGNINVNTTDYLKIRQVNIYNNMGQIIDRISYNYKKIVTIYTDDLSNGMYVFQIILDNNEVNNIFIIK